jgi:hypothetical protein
VVLLRDETEQDGMEALPRLKTDQVAHALKRFHACISHEA